MNFSVNNSVSIQATIPAWILYQFKHQFQCGFMSIPMSLSVWILCQFERQFQGRFCVNSRGNWSVNIDSVSIRVSISTWIPSIRISLERQFKHQFPHGFSVIQISTRVSISPPYITTVYDARADQLTFALQKCFLRLWNFYIFPELIVLGGLVWRSWYMSLNFQTSKNFEL